AKQQRRLRLMRQRCRKAAKRSVTRSRHQPSPLYWGASIGSHLTGTQAPWDMNAVAQFEATAGKKLSLIHFFAPFANCASDCWYYDFPTTPMQSIRDHGAIPFFSWSSQSIPSNLNQPNFRLSTVIAGAHDSYLRKFAEAARDWGHPFFLRFNWEMNGNWFPWSEGVNGNGPGEYVAAWRHVRNVFASVGATNATWVWCPNIDPEDKFQDLGALYPGDAYVDWTCLDGYNWGKSPGAGSAGGSRSSFEDLFGPTYDRIVKTIAPSKPMVIGEVGATERDGSKAAWIADMLSRIPTEYPLIRGLAWFNTYDDGMDWPIETSAGAATAFAKGIKNPFYRVGVYSGLSASPIPPPS
ncbi:MAG: glycosyl hydrolase, partial [Dehalococcoidia bacterium]